MEQDLNRRTKIGDEPATAVDSAVFPIVLQPHFEDRLLWINVAGKCNDSDGVLWQNGDEMYLR